MSGNEIAALIVAITGALTAIFVGIRNLKSDATKAEIDKAANLLAGYDGLQARLQAEIDRLEKARDHDRAEHKQEMADLREEHKAEMLIAYERIDELGSQLYVYVNRSPEARGRTGDNL